MTTALLGSKEVMLSQPYVPGEGHGETLVGREGVCRTVLAAWLGQPGFTPMAPLLVGEPGVGKNRIVYELARMTGRPLFVLQGHEDVTAEDLACAVRFSDDPQRKMDYVLSPLATAMLYDGIDGDIDGGIVFIDEIGKFRARALAPLAPVLDDRRYLDSTLLGKRIYAKSGFRLIAATNSVDLATEALPDFVRSRLRPVLRIGYPPRGEIRRIVEGRFGRIRVDGDGLMKQFWGLWDQHRGGSLPSPRDTLYTFSLAMSLADHEAGITYPGAVARPAKVNKRHLEEAFGQIFTLQGGAE
jgi:MoxR-like ATPase